MNADQGNDYHKRKLISLAIGENNPTWMKDARLHAEAEYAGKFDDIIIEYENGRKEKECLCYQVKHTEKESRRINAADLSTKGKMSSVEEMRNEGKKKYSLVKCFFSYVDLKKNGSFNHGIIKHVILYSNENFNIKDLTHNGIVIDELSEELDGTDHLLSKTKFIKRCNQEAPGRYRIIRVPNLREKCSDYYVISVAKKLADCVFKSTPITNDIFPDSNEVLARKVIDVEGNKFREEFITGEDLSDDIVKFRKMFSSEIEESSRIKLEGINEAILRNGGGLRLGENFGQGGKKRKGSSSNESISISEAEIDDFLKHLVFAVNQPNADQLGKIIKDEIRAKLNREKLNPTTKLDPDATKAIFSILCDEMTDLIQRKGAVLSIKEYREIYEEAIKLCGIRFDVKKPVATFTGRIEELQKLHEALQSQDEARVAICGLGGVGKTELAREYIRLHRQDYDGNVVWINAETSQTLAESFLRLGKDKLKIYYKNTDGQSKDLKSIVDEVYQFFHEKKSLFIFDNAEKFNVSSELDSGIHDFLPNSLPPGSKNPCVLITSRHHEWGERIKSLPLTVFTKIEAVELMKKALKKINVNKESDIENLAEKLQFFPLALRQAIAYINKCGELYANSLDEEFGVINYLAEYERESKKLLSFPFPDDCGNCYTKITFITWNIAIENMKEQKEYLALDILNIIAYFKSDDIPTRLFLRLISEGKKDKELLDAVECLTQYSMVNWGTNCKVSTISINRLVQEVIRIKLRENSDDPNEKLVLKKALALFRNDVNPHDADHAECVWHHASKHTDLVKEFADIPGRISEVLALTGKLSGAISFGKRAGELLAKTVGLDDIRTAATFSAAALAAMERGQIRDGRELFAKIKKRKASVISTVFSRGLVQLFEDMSRDNDVLVSPEVCYDFLTNADNGPALFDARNNLSAFLTTLGYDEAALRILRKNLIDMREYVTSSKGLYPRVARCRVKAMELIGGILTRLGEYREALQMYTNLREILRNGDLVIRESSEVLFIQLDMAAPMLCLGDYNGVLEIYREVFEKNTFSEDKIRTSEFLYVAAKAFEASGNHSESLKLAYEALDIQTSAVDIPDFKIIPKMSHIARVWHKLGENELAIQYYNEVIRRLENSSSDQITDFDILYTHLCIIDIKYKPKSGEITLSALKGLSKETKNTLGANSAWSRILEYYVNRWAKGEDDGVDIREVVFKETIFTEDAEMKNAQRKIRHPLHHATALNRLDIVKCLVDIAKYDVNGGDGNGLTPLHWAVERGSLSIVDYLLSKNADFRARPKYASGMTPLHAAALYGHCDIVQLLLSKGAAVNETFDNGYTALSVAAFGGHLETVRILLNSGANVDTKFPNPDPSIFSPTSPDVDTKRRFETIAAIIESTKRLLTTM